MSGRSVPLRLATLSVAAAIALSSLASFPARAASPLSLGLVGTWVDWPQNPNTDIAGSCTPAGGTALEGTIGFAVQRDLPNGWGHGSWTIDAKATLGALDGSVNPLGLDPAAAGAVTSVDALSFGVSSDAGSVQLSSTGLSDTTGQGFCADYGPEDLSQTTWAQNFPGIDWTNATQRYRRIIFDAGYDAIITPTGGSPIHETGQLEFEIDDYNIQGTHGDVSYGGAELSFKASAPLDHLILSPSAATIPVGGSQAFTAEGFDAANGDLGDETGSTTFSIAPEGTCVANLCSAQAPGVHSVTGTDGSAAGSATLQVPGDFVQRTGTQLTVDSQPFRPIGLDIYNANSNGWCWYPMDGTILDTSLTAIGPGKNVMRAWFFQQLATTNGARDWTAFDRTLATAKAHGYKVIATLVDQWGDCGVSTTPGYGYKDVAWYEGGYKQPDPAGTVSYRDWAQEVASRYQSDPTVMAWQLVNEPEVGDCSTFPEVTATADLKAFAADVSGAIKAVDPNHLISLGTIGSGQCGAQGDDFQDVMSVPTLDLCEFHDYNANQLVPGDAFNGLPRRIDQCNALDKPLIVGELGIKANDVGGTLLDRANLVSNKLCAQLTAGVAGVLLWNWDKDGSILDNYDIGPSDPVLASLAPWSDPSHTCAPPGPPTQVVAAAGPETASVSWVAPASDGGSPIMSYMVSAGPTGPSVVVSPNETTTNLDLVDGTTYAFTVTATNGAGTSLASTASSPVTPTATASLPTTVADIVPAQGTLSTDPGNTGPTPAAPVTAAVTVPDGGSVGIAVGGVTESAPTGFSLLGQQVAVSAPTATAGAPLELEFTLDGSLLGAIPPAQITVYRTEGAGPTEAVPDCTGTPGTASPDPCVSGRTLVGSDLQLTILTSSASIWNLGVDSTPPVVTIDGVSRPFIGASGTSIVTWHANETGTYSVRLGGTSCTTGTQLATGTYASAPSVVAVSVQATVLALGSNTIRVCATDAALNTGSTIATITKDTTAPTVASMVLAGTTPTDAASVSWTVTFSEPVTGVKSSNFLLIRNRPRRFTSDHRRDWQRHDVDGHRQQRQWRRAAPTQPFVADRDRGPGR